MKIYGRKQYGTSAVEEHLGVEAGRVNQWVKATTLGFPKPDATTVGPRSIAGYAWYEESLPALRTWLELRWGMSMADATRHWATVDALIADTERTTPVRVKRPTPQIPGQLAVEL